MTSLPSGFPAPGLQVRLSSLGRLSLSTPPLESEHRWPSIGHRGAMGPSERREWEDWGKPDRRQHVVQSSTLLASSPAWGAGPQQQVSPGA